MTNEEQWDIDVKELARLRAHNLEHNPKRRLSLWGALALVALFAMTWGTAMNGISNVPKAHDVIANAPTAWQQYWAKDRINFDNPPNPPKCLGGCQKFKNICICGIQQ